MNLNIATRRSKLAQVQTDSIIAIVKEKHNLDCEKLLIETEGDRKLDISLDKIGGKGLFVKDIEIALIENRAQAAVHSMKDVPYEIGTIFEIAAMPVREDVRDVLISAEGTHFRNLPQGARIGTSSNRRSAQLKAIRPDIETIPIRGNVQTRIAKMETEKLDGIILAAAGLKRLGFEHMVSEYFEPGDLLPAVGQGALGVEILKHSPTSEVFKSLDNQEVRMCVECERSFMRRLNGGCHTSLGAYAFIEGNLMHVSGIFDVNGKLIKRDVTGDKWDYIRLGEILADKIMKG